MKMNNELYKELVAGYAITYGYVESSRFVFLVVNEILDVEKVEQQGFQPGPDELDSNVIIYAPDVIDKDDGFGRVTCGQGNSRLYVTYKNKIITVNDQFHVYESKEDERVREMQPQEGEDDSFLRNCWGVKNIFGDVYAFGLLRKVFKRNDFNDWLDMTDPSTNPELHKDISEWQEKHGSLGSMSIGFDALDGFASDDLYAGGDRGDLWQFNGSKWKRIDLPSNIKINALVCGGDGKVYIGGSDNKLLIGRDDEWEVVETDTGEYVYATEINSMAWFDDKLWLATDMNLFTFEDNTVAPYDYPEHSAVQHSFKHVTASDTHLMAYGIYQALVFDGESWDEIIGTPALNQSS